MFRVCHTLSHNKFAVLNYATHHALSLSVYENIREYREQTFTKLW